MNASEYIYPAAKDEQLYLKNNIVFTTFYELNLSFCEVQSYFTKGHN